MALQGTLDTFALPDVLRLLASTKKSGRLVVQGDRGSGSLWLEDGSVVSGEASMAPTDTSTDVLFELLRLNDGSFLFDPEDLAKEPGDSVEVEGIIADAQSLHDEWRELSQTIPNLDVGVSLAEELPADEAVITKERWRHLVAIGHGTTVRELGDQLSLRELPVCRAVSGLVDDGLVVVTGTSSGPARTKPADTGLPALGDAPDAEALFGDADGDGGMPEPLPGEGGGESEVEPDPFADAVVGPWAGDGDNGEGPGHTLGQFLDSVRT